MTTLNIWSFQRLCFDNTEGRNAAQQNDNATAPLAPIMSFVYWTCGEPDCGGLLAFYTNFGRLPQPGR